MSGGNARPAIFSADLCDALDEARKFRNLAVRNYDRFNGAKAAPAVAAAGLIASRIVGEISRFRELVDDL